MLETFEMMLCELFWTEPVKCPAYGCLSPSLVSGVHCPSLLRKGFSISRTSGDSELLRPRSSLIPTSMPTAVKARDEG